MRGLLVILSGPSGSGKGTVIGSLLDSCSNLHLSVSMTTRAPREGEKEGIHYFFVSKETFQKMIAEDALLEYAEYVDNYYGTPKAYVEECLARGEHVLLEIEPQGASKVLDLCPEAVSIFVLPPSMKELERRLRGRGTETDEVIRGRLAQAARELTSVYAYQYALINEDSDRTAVLIREIIEAEEHKVKNMSQQINEVLDKC